MKSNLLTRALAYNMDAHRANPANLIAGTIGMLVNNVIFLVGIWGMLFAGKPVNSQLLPYYIALNAVVMTSWGVVNFLWGGLRSLGEMISEGTLEPMLATPRDPLILAGISRSHPVALGDLIMGVFGMGLIAVEISGPMALRTALATLVSIIGFTGLFVSAGALCFFIPRGNRVGYLFIELVLSLSVYPTGKIFAGAGRIVLLATPAAVTAILPLEAVEDAGVWQFVQAFAGALGFLALSVVFFRAGLKRYRAVSLIGAQG